MRNRQSKGEKMANGKKTNIDRSSVLHHVKILGHDGFGVTELRIFDPQPMVTYIDNIADGIRLASGKDGQTSGIYVGVQPRNIDLFDYAPNCWKPAVGNPQSNCASDRDIEYITAVFFDVDVVSPHRKTGCPASDEELQKSQEAALLLAGESGLASCSAICCSGNGHYVLTPIVPITVDSDEMPLQFKQFYQQLAARVSRQAQGVKLDPVYNLSRVMRLMGTVNRKGIETSDRSYRRAHFVTEPLPTTSYALHHMILNTEVAVSQKEVNAPSNALKCDLAKIEACEFIKWCRQHALDITEPQWFAMITNLARLEGGPKLIHQISALDLFRYDYQQTQRLIERVLRNGYSQTNCDKLSSLGFYCPKLGRCPVKAPMYLTALYSKYSS